MTQPFDVMKTRMMKARPGEYSVSYSLDYSRFTRFTHSLDAEIQKTNALTSSKQYTIFCGLVGSPVFSKIEVLKWNFGVVSMVKNDNLHYHYSQDGDKAHSHYYPTPMIVQYKVGTVLEYSFTCISYRYRTSSHYCTHGRKVCRAWGACASQIFENL